MSDIESTPELPSICIDVCIVVTVYNPNIEALVLNVETYIDQVGLIVICDNSDNEVNRREVFDAFGNFANVAYINMSGNVGIAAAQNHGIRYGIQERYEFFIEMDQDSKLPPNFVRRIFNSYQQLVEDGHSVAGIGPVAIRDDGFIYDQQKVDNRVVSVDKTLSSGFFFSKSSFEHVGPKDESLFIDYVDWEWCWRATYRGFTTYVDRGLSISHMLGNGHRRILGFDLGLPAPIRHYYQYRNGLILLARGYIPLSWRSKRIAIMCLKAPIYALFVGDRVKRSVFMLKGVIDGVLRRTGKIAW